MKSSPLTSKPKILLIYTGGTIGMIKDHQSNALRPFDFNNLLHQIPEINLIQAELNFFSFDSPIDSSDFDHKGWQKLGNIIKEKYNHYDGFVVLHGTDTMAYTASALSFMLKGLQKPVIFTGSQLPIGDLRTDARENLMSSIHFAALQKDEMPCIKEVCIYFEYKIYRANRSTKMNAEYFDAFRSPNYPILGESGVNIHLNEPMLYTSRHKNFDVIDGFSPNVGLLKIYPSMKSSFLQAALQDESLEALILETFGSGNIFHRHDFLELLKEKIKKGMHLIITTQCLGGGVSLGKYSASQVFNDLGAISAEDMTTEATITKAMFLLGNPSEYSDFSNAFSMNLRGEKKG